jgi:hypothetical protein
MHLRRLSCMNIFASEYFIFGVTSFQLSGYLEMQEVIVLFTKELTIKQNRIGDHLTLITATSEA